MFDWVQLKFIAEVGKKKNLKRPEVCFALTFSLVEWVKEKWVSVNVGI